MRTCDPSELRILNRLHAGMSLGQYDEIGYENGPFRLNRQYRLQSEVICVGQSPQTEYVWYETTAQNEAGEIVAKMRMQSRSMKASAPAYRS